MLKFIFTTSCVLLSWVNYGQALISGMVYDARTETPLAGATARIEPSNQATVTDQFGRFQFKVAPGEQYSITVSFIGYDSKTETLNSGHTELNISLVSSSIITDAVVVSSTRATEKTPTTFTTITKEAIQQQNFGQDVPFLFNWTPSVVTTSDAGTGVGYTGIRIRGSDPTRINVTINGIPYNDSESLGTYWVDIPDIASSAQSVQIQRGVGTSTNGAGAFGVSINLQTNYKSDKPYAEVINSGGSFNTHRHTFSFGTGRMNENWVVEGRVSKIGSDGYIDRATADLKSYYFSGGYYARNTIIKAIMFGGKERTYQSWYGVPQSRLNNDDEAMNGTIGNEGWNEIQAANLKNSNSRTFNPYTYDNQVDDYQQDNFQLHFSQQLNSEFTLNTSLHYTPGKGYYEEYRYDDAFENYGLDSVVVDQDTVGSSDMIRRRWLDNDFYGFTYSLNYDIAKMNVVIGGGWNRYEGDHFGEIIWAAVSPAAHEYQYYLSKGDKRDFNSYVKVNCDVTENLNAYADLQFRKITYRATGFEYGSRRIDLNIDTKFNFFNPKFGLTYNLSSKQQMYASYAIANREPLRDDFINQENEPKHETLRNVEIGYRTTGKNYLVNANVYYMGYKNQLVLTGEVNNSGAYIRTNAGKSHRMGIELEAGLRLSKKLQWNANLTVSQNKIESFTEVLEDYGDNFDQFNIVKNEYKDVDISFSPGVIAGSQLAFQPIPAVEVTLLTKYVGKQFLDNTGNEERIIPSYFVNDLRVGYNWKPSFVKEISFSLLVNNLLNHVYESNGYTWGYLGGATAYRENYYYPQAGRNFMAMIAVKF